MNGPLIAQLTACAETPGMPPYLPFADALTDGNEHPPEQSEGIRVPKLRKTVSRTPLSKTVMP